MIDHTEEILEGAERSPRIAEDEDQDPAHLKRELHQQIGKASRDPLPPGVPASLLDKSLRITSTFEGEGYGQVSGDFDGEAASVGALQQCIGQNSLQPLLREMFANHRDALVRLWSEPIVNDFQIFLNMGHEDQMHWCRLNIGKAEHPDSRWADRLRVMAKSPEYIAIQQKYATAIFLKAVALASSFGFVQENAVALMFDIVTQNGSIKDEHRARINGLIADEAARTGKPVPEDKKLECVALGRAWFSKERWQADVATRKLCVARRKTAPFWWKGTQYSGRVHGETRDLEHEVGLTNTAYKV